LAERVGVDGVKDQDIEQVGAGPSLELEDGNVSHDSGWAC